MSSILTTKTLGIVGAIAGVSAIGGSLAYGTGLFNNSKEEKIALISNKERLGNEGFELLNTAEDNAEWQKIFTEYNTAKAGTFKEGGGEDKSRTNPQLREQCESQLSLNTEESYKLTRRWCVKQEKMSEILKRKSKVLANTEDKKENDGEWKTKITSLTDSDKTSLGITIGEVETTNINAIKAGCKTATEKKTTDAEFNEKFEIAKRVCTIAKD